MQKVYKIKKMDSREENVSITKLLNAGYECVYSSASFTLIGAYQMRYTKLRRYKLHLAMISFKWKRIKRPWPKWRLLQSENCNFLLFLCTKASFWESNKLLGIKGHSNNKLHGFLTYGTSHGLPLLWNFTFQNLFILNEYLKNLLNLILLLNKTRLLQAFKKAF